MRKFLLGVAAASMMFGAAPAVFAQSDAAYATMTTSSDPSAALPAAVTVALQTADEVNANEAETANLVRAALVLTIARLLSDGVSPDSISGVLAQLGASDAYSAVVAAEIGEVSAEFADGSIEGVVLTSGTLGGRSSIGGVVVGGGVVPAGEFEYTPPS